MRIRDLQRQLFGIAEEAVDAGDIDLGMAYTAMIAAAGQLLMKTGKTIRVQLAGEASAILRKFLDV